MSKSNSEVNIWERNRLKARSIKSFATHLFWLRIVTIILVAEGTYAWEGIWCGLASTLVLALAGAWYGWNNAKLPGVGGKVAYILTVLIILATILFVPLYMFA